MRRSQFENLYVLGGKGTNEIIHRTVATACSSSNNSSHRAAMAKKALICMETVGRTHTHTHTHTHKSTYGYTPAHTNTKRRKEGAEPRMRTLAKTAMLPRPYARETDREIGR